MRRHWPRAAWVAGITAALYALLTVLVATGASDGWDATAREWFRPEGTWGTAQLRADVVVEGLRPSRAGLLLVVVATSVALRRRSWWPVLVASAVAILVSGLVALTQLLVARPDTHGALTGLGGSYPSGHVATLLAALGGCLLALGVRRWPAWVVVALVDLVMGGCLLLQAAHWLTDVVGGALAGVCVLAAVAAGEDHLARSYRSGSSKVSTPSTSRVTL